MSADPLEFTQRMHQRKKEAKFEEILFELPIINISELRKLCWNGIPPPYRAICWQLLLGHMPAASERRDYMVDKRRREYHKSISLMCENDTANTEASYKQVELDVERSADPHRPMHAKMLSDHRVKNSLTHLLVLLAVRNPASGYVQGMLDIATPLFCVLLGGYFGGVTNMDIDIDAISDDVLRNVEADTYWCLRALLSEMQNRYTSDQPAIQSMIFLLEEVVRRVDPQLHAHIRHCCGVEFHSFAFRWMNCMLVRELSMQSIIRVWDSYLSEDDVRTSGSEFLSRFDSFHVYFCASLLTMLRSEILQECSSFDELMMFLQQQVPQCTREWDTVTIESLLSQAFVCKESFSGSERTIMTAQATSVSSGNTELFSKGTGGMVEHDRDDEETLIVMRL